MTQTSTAPTLQELAALVASNPEETARIPFQHMEDIFLLSVHDDVHQHALDFVGDGTPYDPANKKHKARYMHPRYTAWTRGEWRFIGLEVMLARRPDMIQALWGIESDAGPDHLGQILHDLCSEILYDLQPKRPAESSAPLARDVVEQRPAIEEMALAAEEAATACEEKAKEALEEAEEIWRRAYAPQIAPERRQLALSGLDRAREIMTRQYSIATAKLKAANMAYAQGAPRPTPPFIIWSQVRLISSYFARLDWMANALQDTDVPAIQQEAPPAVRDVFMNLGLDARLPADALTLITTHWPDSTIESGHTSWGLLDQAAIWAKSQPEVYHLGKQHGIEVNDLMLPSWH